MKVRSVVGNPWIILGAAALPLSRWWSFLCVFVVEEDGVSSILLLSGVVVDSVNVVLLMLTGSVLPSFGISS